MKRLINRTGYRLHLSGLKKAIPLLLALLIAGCGGASRLRVPTGEPVFYPALPDTPRIQYLTHLRSSDDIEPQGRFEKYVLGKRQDIALRHAYGITSNQGKLYVCDSQRGFVITFDLRKRKFSWVDAGKQGQIRKPLAMAVADDGMKYVADGDQSRIIVLDSSDQIANYLGDENLFRPVDVAVFKNRLYVADMRDREIQVLDRKTGEVLGAIGEPGADPGQFSAPTSINVDMEGNIYATDLINTRVQKFSPEGDLLLDFGRSGRLPGDFARPKGITIDHDGIIYVVDAAYENVQVFDQEGQILMFFGGYGDTEGSMWLPAKIAIDYDPEDIAYFSPYVAGGQEIRYLILVSNQIGPSHIGVYGFLKRED